MPSVRATDSGRPVILSEATDLLTSAETAAVLGMKPLDVQKLAKEGKIRRQGPYFWRPDVERLLTGRARTHIGRIGRERP
jgi:hypothetical protein